CPQATVPHPLLAGTGAVTIFVVLRAFSSGSTALTGVEAIANGVNAFRRPHGRNAAATMLILGTMAIAMFLGVSWLAVHMHARPTMTGTPSVLSELARGVFPSSSTFGFMYWVVQTLTLGVLILAANTSYQGFPRLAALLARDRFFARQFTNLGDRLVFSNGIIVLTAIAMALLWAYNASVNSLIHLYVIGVFTAFTLSQFGMVRYWLRTRDRGWSHRIVVNAVGATATGVVTLVVVCTKFAEGAWLVTAARPLTNEVLLAVGSIDAATERALWYAHRISVPGRTRALLVPGSHTDSGIRARWWSVAGDSPRLEVLSNDEGRVHTLLEEVWRLPRGESDFVTLLVPEQFS